MAAGGRWPGGQSERESGGQNGLWTQPGEAGDLFIGMRNCVFSVVGGLVMGRGAAALCLAVGLVHAAGTLAAGQATELPAAAPSPSPTAAKPAAEQPLVFTVTWDAAMMAKPYTGRVYVMMTSARRATEPRMMASNWFRPPVILALDVKDVVAGTPVTIASNAPGVVTFPAKAEDLRQRISPEAKLRVQAIARLSKVDPVPGTGAGDLYSEPAEVEVGQTATLKLTKAAERKKFKESTRIKEFTLVSPSLSAFHGFEYTLRAGVSLPVGWSEEAVAGGKTWPVVYSVTGFGSDHQTVSGTARSEDFRDCIVVVPDASNFHGHSVFADSANTGPWGKALTQELIPALETKFGGPIRAAAEKDGVTERVAASSSRRFTTGVSSGGWSSLWLVVAYPDFFDSCWSHVPDPVDFRDFQQIDLTTAGVNMYTDPKGNRRPIGRMGGNPSLWYDDFVAMERALGPGGQIDSFEAVFSPRGSDGRPVPLFDRATGKVDPAVAKAWEPYDIRLKLEREWKQIGPKLAGKVHVYAGEEDNFYLEGAARLLKASLKELGSDAVVEIVPGMPHTLHGAGQAKMIERMKQRQTEFEKAK